MNPSAILAAILLIAFPIDAMGQKKPYQGKKTTSPKPTPAELEFNVTTPLMESTLAVTENVTVATSTVAELVNTTLLVQETSPVIVVETTTLAPIPETVPIQETTTAKMTERTSAPIEITETPELTTLEQLTPSTPELVEGTTEAPVTGAPLTPSARPVIVKKTPAPIPTLPPVDFDCSKKEDGLYPDPKDKCSSIFYACVGGLGRRLQCGAGGLVFEPETKTCERRHESFRCTGVRRTTMPTTPRRPPPPPVKLAIDCSKLDDGWFADPKLKCSHVFYSCSNGIGSRFECPAKMYFDIETSTCQPFQDVVACAGKKRVTTKRPFTTDKPIPKEKLPIDCSKLVSGSHPDPSKKCSDIYYVCSNGDGFKRVCPKGTYFDVKKDLCDYYEDVFACSGRTRKPTKPTPAPKPSPASLPSNEFNCTKKDDKSYLPESQKCSNHYFRCVGGVAYKVKCPEGLYYDLENDVCDRWMNLFVCSGRKPTSPKPTTTIKPPTTEKLPIDCGKLSDGDYSDPEKKCSSTYYTCSNYLGSRRLCPQGTFFDKNARICDSREYVMECGGKPRPVTKPTTRRPIPKIPYDCEKLSDGNYMAGKCESKYYACIGGTTAESECPRGTYYDSELDECGYKHEIPACGGVRPTKKPN